MTIGTMSIGITLALVLQAEPVTLSGQVIKLTTELSVRGLPADPAPIAEQVVLRDASGEVVPLLPDEASRALFLDDQLRHRRAEIVGRRHSGLPYLQVLSVRVEDDGKLRTPEYVCDVCAIHVRYPQQCPCCQGPMSLRFGPESP